MNFRNRCSPEKKQFAREQRNNPTLAEEVLWVVSVNSVNSVKVRLILRQTASIASIASIASKGVIV